MNSLYKNLLLGGVAVSALAIATPVIAQETSASIRANVTDASGTSMAGKTVVITNTRTGSARTVTTSASGSIFVRNLPVGGPYTITVSGDGRTEKVENIFLQLGQTFSANIVLSDDNLGAEEIVVTAERLTTTNVATGPSSVFGLSDLENTPAINRDIKDIIRLDPRVYIDESNSGAIQCAGANPRFNSLTVDGVGLNDNFGLNSNGYPTERLPFPFAAINQVAVELAPFNVEYGAFTSCNVNAVTKSGTNELHGSAFFDITSDGLLGNDLEGDVFDDGEFEEKRYGATLGGPIIKDKLFFFAAYEKLEGAALFDRGVQGSGAAREVPSVTQADLDRIIAASQNLYGFDPGGLPSSLPVSDEKLLAKIDWNINDQHRFAFTFNYNDGFNIAQSDNDDDELELSNHYYERGAKLYAYTGQLFSDWTENFSTDIRVSHTDLDNRQNSLIGAPIGEAQIDVGDTTVYVGGDDSRQSNDLYYKIWNYKLAGTYQAGDHAITLGFERLETEVFNLFVQHTNGEYRFSSIEDYENGTPWRVYYGNAPSLNPIDAGGSLDYAINTVYLQDEFLIPDANLSITAGVRFDWYENSGLPRENANFIARNGFTNATNFDGRSLFLPRLGFNWDATDRISVHGGIGIYSGGNPNVWLTNNYQNDGFTQIQTRISGAYDENFTLFDDPTANGGRPISDIPQQLVDRVTSGSSNFNVNAFDPDFEIPTQVKVALGAKVDFDAGMFGDDYKLGIDFLYSKTRDAATLINASLEEVATAPDGRPIYNDPFPNDLIFTNAEDGGRFYVMSASLQKSFNNGIDTAFSYAFTDATDANPMGASTAGSNFAGPVASDRNNLAAATSNWEIKHRFTARFSYAHDFWDDNTTRLTLFGSLQSGRPYSVVYNDGFDGLFLDGVRGRSSIYVPTGIDDPLIQWGGRFVDADGNVRTDVVNNFMAFLDRQGLDEYAGEIAPRNSSRSRWWGKVDLRLSQEIPSFFEGHKLTAFMSVENFTNLLNNSWGIQRHAGYFGNFTSVDASLNGDNSQYVYEDFRTGSQVRRSRPSQWKIRFGISYKF